MMSNLFGTKYPLAARQIEYGRSGRRAGFVNELVMILLIISTILRKRLKGRNEMLNSH